MLEFFLNGPPQGPEHMGVGSLVLELGPQCAALSWGLHAGAREEEGGGAALVERNRERKRAPPGDPDGSGEGWRS